MKLTGKASLFSIIIGTLSVLLADFAKLIFKRMDTSYLDIAIIGGIMTIVFFIAFMIYAKIIHNQLTTQLTAQLTKKITSNNEKLIQQEVLNALLKEETHRIKYEFQEILDNLCPFYDIQQQTLFSFYSILNLAQSEKAISREITKDYLENIQKEGDNFLVLYEGVKEKIGIEESDIKQLGNIILNTIDIVQKFYDLPEIKKWKNGFKTQIKDKYNYRIDSFDCFISKVCKIWGKKKPKTYVFRHLEEKRL